MLLKGNDVTRSDKERILDELVEAIKKGDKGYVADFLMGMDVNLTDKDVFIVRMTAIEAGHQDIQRHLDWYFLR